MSTADARVRLRLDHWKSKLIDTTRRNRLLYFKPSANTLRLTAPTLSELFRRLTLREQALHFYSQEPEADLLDFDGENGEKPTSKPPRPLRADEARADASDRQLWRALYTLRQKGHASLQEQGVVTLFVTLGLIEWKESPSSSEPIRSPLLLIPVDLTHESAHAPYKLALFEDDLTVNPTLAHKLYTDFGITLPDLPDLDGFDLEAFFHAVAAALPSERGWSVVREAYLGLFSFHKVAMYQDLTANAAQICEHPLLRALGGDTSRLSPPPADLPVEADMDRKVLPAVTFQILDADSSQQEAIQAARRGLSFTLQGPPGTGKSQTIANIIAESLADDKKVLFVSEKMAALDVVFRRLSQQGLGDFCLQAHSHKANKRDVIQELGYALDAARNTSRADAPDFDDLLRSRERLNAYAAALHVCRPPLNRTVYQVHGEMARLMRAPDLLFPVEDAAGLSPDRLTVIAELLDDLERYHDVLVNYAQHPWFGVRVTEYNAQSDKAALRVHLGALQAAIQTLQERGHALADACGLTFPSGMEDMARLLSLAGLLIQSPVPPRAWFTPGLLAPLLAAAHDHQARFAQHRSRREALLRVYTPALFQLPHAAVTEQMTARAVPLLTRVLPAEKSGADCLVQHRAYLEATFPALLTTLGELEAAGSALAAACGVAKVSSINAVEHLLTLARLIARSPLPLPAWFETGALSRLRPAAHAYRDRMAEWRSRRETLLAAYTPDVFTLAHEDLIERLTVRHQELLRQVLPGREAPDDRIVSEQEKLCGTLGRVQTLLPHLQEEGARLAQLVGLQAPTTLPSLRELCNTIDLLMVDPRPQPHWFERARLAALKTEADTAAQHISAYRSQSAQVKARYEEAILGLDHAALLFCFTGVYTSAWRALRPDYRRDMKTLRSLLLQPAKLTCVAAIQDLKLAQQAAQNQAWIESRRDAHRFDFGSHYDGWDTQWSSVLAALDGCRNILNRLGDGGVPARMVQLLVASGSQMEALRRQYAAVRGGLTRLDQEWDALRHWFALDKLLLTGQRWEDAKLDTLRSWAARVYAAAQDITSAYKTVTACRRAGPGGTPATCEQAREALNAARQVVRIEAALNAHAPTLAQEFGVRFVGVETDWNAILAALDWTTQAQEWFASTPTPEFIRAVCAPERDAARQEIGRQCERAQGLLLRLKQEVTGLQRFIRLEPVPPAQADLFTAPMRDVWQWQERLYDHLRGFLQARDAVMSCRRAEASTDCDTAALVSAMREASDVLKLEADMQARAADMRQDFGNLFAGEQTRWETVLAALDWTKQVLAYFGEATPPGAFIAIACGERSGLETVGRDLPRLEAARVVWQEETAHLVQRFTEASEARQMREWPFNQAQIWAQTHAAQLNELDRWIALQRLRPLCAQAGLNGFLAAITRDKPAAGTLKDVFWKRFWALWLDEVSKAEPALSAFDGDRHDTLVERFRALDTAQMQVAQGRLRQRLLARRPAVGLGQAAGGELGALLKERGKRGRFKPLRKLFGDIPNLLQALKPCLLMSPLSVATFLDPTRLQFDVILFDEASQICSEDAIGTILRGKQIIIVGDRYQLPPTRFFAASTDGFDEESEEDEATQEIYESILDECATIGLPNKMLRWHYRSRCEALIAFSNHHFYRNQLVTFPGPHAVAGDGEERCVQWHYVPDGVYMRGKSKDAGANRVEARHVAEMVFSHFERFPEQSLGVIAFSERQQTAIDDELRRLRRLRPEFEAFFVEEAQEGREPFFIKNLESVQGDERDVIVFSVGYGPDQAGKTLMNFGPLNREGGERRLNVAVTRARYRVHLVSSLQPQDMDMTRTGARGVALLKAYLEYAQAGPASLAREVTVSAEAEFDSPFEEAVSDALEAQGLTIHRQVGCAGYRIDLAVVDDTHPGEYLLGIECDGATYHSSRTARDRDRLRQQVLEGLGWKLMRIWSTDWVRRPDEQLQRVLKAVADISNTPPPPPPAKVVILPPGEGEMEDVSLHPSSEVPETLPQQALPVAETPNDVTEYQICLLPTQGQPHQFFHLCQTRPASILDVMQRVAAQEGPIHISEATRRIASAWSFPKVTPTLTSWIEHLAVHGSSQNRFLMRNEFLWPCQTDHVPVRTSATTGYERNIAHVALEEIAEAAAICLRQAYSMTEDALVVQTARLLGYNRTGPKVRERVQAGIHMATKQGVFQARKGSVCLAKGNTLF